MGTIIVSRETIAVWEICFLTFISLFAFVNLINGLFTIYMVDNKTLILKSLLKKISLNLKDVEHIIKQPAGKFVGTSIVVLTKYDKITITALTKNYKDLLKLVINNCKEQSNVKIDQKVNSIIKQK